MAGRDDKTDDPTIVWPDTRKNVELGIVSITKAVADSQAAEKKLLFVPGALVPGIEAADPMIGARSAAYIVSLASGPGTVTDFAARGPFSGRLESFLQPKP